MKKLRQHITFKSISGIVLLLLVFSVIISVIGNHGFTDALLNQYSDNAFHTARIAAVVVDGDRIDEYWESGGETEAYRSVWESLTRLCNSSGATFVYVIEPDRTDYAHIRFLFSTINQNSHYSLYDFGYLRETTNDEYRVKYRALYEGESDQELVVRDKGYIETDPHITAMIPLKNSGGEVVGILCVQQQLDILLQARNTYLRRVVIAFFSLALFVVIGQSLYLHRALLHPLKQISEEATRFSRENVMADKKLQDTVRSRDEIGQLAASIDHMEEQIDLYIDNITRVTAEKERIGAELSLATRIQTAMLPHVFPPFPDRKEFDIYASMNPAKEIGGDFYDFFLIDDDHLCLVVADVSGKGIPAALFMMASKIILQSCAMLDKSPAEILKKTNEAICSNNQEEMFVTVWVGIMEVSTGKITAANAGHEYPVLQKTPNGKFELIKDKHGFVIGGMPETEYTEYELQMEPGTKIFLYTDGVPEATDEGNNLFGVERMLKALNEATDQTPIEVLQTVRASVDSFVNDAEQFDDLTMLCVEYKGKGSD
ncbi:MAG: SpoIIE family protein phosphatase [Oscillospiraceae bacterium]|nr:SpoIIE family protein phosphatase [Oscillospiraceae bacterium]